MIEKDDNFDPQNTSNDADELEDIEIDAIQYNEFCSFTNLEKVLDLIKQGVLDKEKWKRNNTSLSDNGTRIWFECARKSCPKKLWVETTNTLARGKVLISDEEHKHAVKAKKSSYSKSTLYCLSELCKSKSLLRQLKIVGLEETEKMSLNNFFKEARKIRSGRTADNEQFTISLATTQKIIKNLWIQDETSDEEEDQEIRVVRHKKARNKVV